MLTPISFLVLKVFLHMKYSWFAMLYQSLMYPAVLGLSRSFVGSSFHHVSLCWGPADSLEMRHMGTSCGREGSVVAAWKTKFALQRVGSQFPDQGPNCILHWKADSQQDHQEVPYNVVLVSGVKIWFHLGHSQEIDFLCGSWLSW